MHVAVPVPGSKYGSAAIKHHVSIRDANSPLGSHINDLGSVNQDNAMLNGPRSWRRVYLATNKREFAVLRCKFSGAWENADAYEDYNQRFHDVSSNAMAHNV